MRRMILIANAVLSIGLLFFFSPAAESTDTSIAIDKVFVKGGCFLMGDAFGDGAANERPMHEVCVDDFYMGKCEVTQGQWKAVMGNNSSTFKQGDAYPVEGVSWNDALAFMRELNRKTGKKHRLPT